MGLNCTIFGIGNDTISRIDGIILLAVFAYYLYLSFKNDAGSEQEEETRTFSTALSIIMIAGGLAGLILGGKLFVNSASEIARLCNVPEAFIAITVMAGGTSLPELATCVVAAAKKRGQLALGNIIGSNISNILLIIGGAAVVRPLPVKGITPVDFGVMLLSAIMILASAYLFKKKELDRVEGVILLLTWGGYMAWLITSL